MFEFYSCSAQRIPVWYRDVVYLYLFVLQILLSGLNSERIGMIPSHSYVHLPHFVYTLTTAMARVLQRVLSNRRIFENWPPEKKLQVAHT